MEDGSYKQAFEGPITPSTPWLRYVYSKFDFTAVNDPGLYVIEYADQRRRPSPSKDAYANIWQDSLDHHLAEQMDHVSVREGYRVWHGASHLDDGRLSPVVGEQFDNWNQATATEGKYKAGDHILGMNVGGWYDAGDFDLEEPAQLSVIQSLALAYREFDLKYDELTVDEAAREVEMHRPDGVPDTVQQVKHGALLILAQFHKLGHSIRGTQEPDLRQYTHLGDGASKTDGRIYDPKLGPNEVKGDYSGKPETAGYSPLRTPSSMERHRGAGGSGRCAERLGQRVSERLPRDRDQSMERRKAHRRRVGGARLLRSGSGGDPRRRRARCVSGWGVRRSRQS